MSKRQEKEQNLNIINPFNSKDKRTIDSVIWIVPLIAMIFTSLVIITIVINNAFEKEKAKLELEAYVINNAINEEFSVALNSINLNGYMEIFEQYMKTSTVDMTSSIYYDEASKTLENVTNISDNIVTTFAVSFQNKALVAAGITEDVIYNYEYESQPWYDYKKVKQNQMYVSNNFKLAQVSSEELFAIVRPVVDTMNDELLGVVAFCYEEDYLNKVFKSAVNDKIDAVIYTDTGKVVLNTSRKKSDKTMIEENSNQGAYVSTRKTNESLSWIVETYMHGGKVVLNSWLCLLVVLALFAIVIYTYINLINHLKAIKVVDKKEKIVIEEKEEIIEEKIEQDYEDLAIEDVLGDEKELDNSYMEDEVIIAGEIIFDKKNKK